jgi:ribonuclease PH
LTFMTATRLIARHAIKDQVSAVSCGIFQGTPVLDLDYAEDSAADTDANFVFTGGGGLVEVQGTAEGAPFSDEQFTELLRLARQGATMLVAAQKEALKL